MQNVKCKTEIRNYGRDYLHRKNQRPNRRCSGLWLSQAKLPQSYLDSPGLTQIGPLLWQAKQTVSALCQLQPATQVGQSKLPLANLGQSTVYLPIRYSRITALGMQDGTFCPLKCSSKVQSAYSMYSLLSLVNMLQYMLPCTGSPFASNPE